MEILKKQVKHDIEPSMDINVFLFDQVLNSFINSRQEIDCRASTFKNFSMISFYNWRYCFNN